MGSKYDLDNVYHIEVGANYKMGFNVEKWELRLLQDLRRVEEG